ncbi:MAG: pyridoxal-phosphate dependent enzyme [Cellvibrionaceae bacterium]|nr:pyridoxal-phosphate dependent enzyme [Cellvibrionaceae bacterium]
MTHLLPANWPELAPETIARIAPLQNIHHPAFTRAKLRVSLKREDLLHPILGGNKVYKLLGHLKNWRRCGGKPLASFGGAYSNHLLALAAAGAALRCPTWGVVRGERPPLLSPTLADAEAFGMRLHFISRSDYRRRGDAAFAAQLEKTLGEVYWIAEGGAGLLALSGCQALAREIVARGSVDVLCHACGTGASLAGLAAGCGEGVQSLGIAVLRGDLDKMRSDVAAWLAEAGIDNLNWAILPGFAAGGYGKLHTELLEFMTDFYRQTAVPLDAVYTAKLMRAVVILAERGYWPAHSHIAVVHSGGLQGNRGFPQLQLGVDGR